MNPEAKRPGLDILLDHKWDLTQDPFCYDAALLGALSFMGYPVEVREVVDEGTPVKKVFVDSTKTGSKILEIDGSIRNELVTMLTDVEDGQPDCLIAHVLSGQEFEMNIFEPAFMQAFERGTARESLSQALYTQLVRRQITPLDPEAMSLLIAADITRLRRENPQLNP